VRAGSYETRCNRGETKKRKGTIASLNEQRSSSPCLGCRVIQANELLRNANSKVNLILPALRLRRQTVLSVQRR
jgi:hypothetical protein